jgi:hypothetical protein
VEIAERKWQHPTGGKPKTVIVVGLGPSHHEYDQAWLAPDTPDVLWQADEIWGINRGVFNIEHDLQFVMDWVEGEALRFPVYGAKLFRHTKPIITSEVPPGWPAHIHRYPFEEIWTWFQSWPKVEWQDIYGETRTTNPAPVHCDWWHNSVAYIIAYACYVGIEKLYCWGLDYHHHKSGRVEDGHVNVAYWVGIAERAGLQVIPYSNSTFLNADQRGWIYGYPPARDPRPAAAAKRAMFNRFAGFDKGEVGDG